MEVDTIELVAGGVGTAVAAFLSAFVYRFGAGKLVGRKPPKVASPPQDFEDDTGLHMLQLVHADDQQVQLRVLGELAQRIYRWTLEERQARALDQLGRETQAQTAEAVQAIAIALDRERALNSQRDMRATSIAGAVHDQGQAIRAMEQNMLLMMDLLRRMNERRESKE